jgi:hypothetical protein
MSQARDKPPEEMSDDELLEAIAELDCRLGEYAEAALQEGSS